jgi:uncharacterized protein DUF4430
MPGRLAPLVALAALLALAGCGLGAGRAPTDVRLEVTRDFGAHSLLRSRAPRVRGQETVMSLLIRNSKVGTRYDGGFVQSIDGFSGGHEGTDPIDWFYYVNGLQAGKGAAETVVRPGDRIWWDRHDWSQAEGTPAVVGSFPEPFTGEIEGKRLPVRVECTQPAAAPCKTVTRQLRAVGVVTAVAAPSGAPSPLVLRLLVGTFGALASDPAVQALEHGPSTSGVYARVATGGGSIALLDPHGATRATLGAGAGLVAATRHGEDAPVWIVGGTDARGVLAAAQALDETALHERFALAIGPAGPVALPDQGP